MASSRTAMPPTGGSRPPYSGVCTGWRSHGTGAAPYGSSGDQTGLSVTPKLWTSIQDALDGSKYFVLLASPEAANSPWVNREIEHWLATKSPDRILPVVTDGEWRWDPAARDFTADSTAVPAELRGVFVEEPLFLDLRWARDDLYLSLQHVRFRDAIAQLAAPMHGVSKDETPGAGAGRGGPRGGEARTGPSTSPNCPTDRPADIDVSPGTAPEDVSS